MKRLKKRLAFTLTELIIIIAIISILAAIIVIAVNPVQIFINARNSQRTADMSSFKVAFERFFNEAPSATPKSLSNFYGYDAMIANANSSTPTSVCPNATNFSSVTNPFNVTTGNSTNTLSIDNLTNGNFLSKPLKDPSNNNYKACIDVCNNGQVVIYSDVVEGIPSNINVPLGKLGKDSPTTVFPCYVQSASAYSPVSTNSFSASLPQSVTPGNLIVVAITTWDGSTPGVSSVTDNKGNGNYIRAFQQTNLINTSVWYVNAINGGANFTITANPVTSDNGNYPMISVHEYKGLTFNTVDTVKYAYTGNGSGQSAGVLSTGNSATTTQAKELLFSTFSAFYGNSTPLNAVFTQGANYTQREATGYPSNLQFTQDRSVASIGSYSATSTFGMSTAGWTGVLVIFK